MDAQQLKRYIRLIYTKAFRYLGAVLVLCALIGGIYGNRLHFVFASCAAGSVMMTNADFDDDLVNATACNENEFSKENIIASRMYARAACGVMLIVISFIVNI